MAKKAFVTGITGQDGSYLTELLLEKNYEVYGLIRRSSSFNTARLEHLYKDPHQVSRLHLEYGNLTDGTRLSELIRDIHPDEIYNLGTQSHVRVSFDEPVYSVTAGALGTLNVLEGIRRLDPMPKYYQASSSEMYGLVQEVPQSEKTPFHPRSPYGCAKVYSYWQTVNYREAYGMYACNGILFNHESPRRGETFVTRKITRAATKIKLGLQDKLYLGNLDAKRDWGFAGDYVKAMWLMLQQDEPEDFVIATGTTTSVRDFTDKAFKEAGITLKWQGTGKDEIGVIEEVQGVSDAIRPGQIVVKIDPTYYRPTEVDMLIGDASKANTKLGWTPKYSLDEMIAEMVGEDLKLMQKDAHSNNAGFKTLKYNE